MSFFRCRLSLPALIAVVAISLASPLAAQRFGGMRYPPPAARTAGRTPSPPQSEEPRPAVASAVNGQPSVAPRPNPTNPSGLPPAQWIWLPGVSQGRVPTGDAYFRKTIQLPQVPVARIQVAADDMCEVYINGRRVGTGTGVTQLTTHECASLIAGGDNLIAIRVSNRYGSTAALFARFFVQLPDGQWRGMGTSDTWKCSDRLQAGWQLNTFDDARWSQAVRASDGPIDAVGAPQPSTASGATAGPSPSTPSAQPLLTSDKPSTAADARRTASGAPAPVAADNAAARTDEASSRRTAPLIAQGDKVIDRPAVDGWPASFTATSPRSGGALEGRFRVPEGFVVEQIVDEIDSGSVLAMAFNEFGHIICSQEGGPLLLVYEAGKNRKTQRVRTYCDAVRNVQGILPLNGDVYVSADGPEGSGLYRLVDADRDGQLEKCELIFGVKGSPGEHGIHQIAIGPDGMLYVVMGNHVQIDAPISPTSPYRFTYEGDLVQPRLEDPSGHAAGVKAPGGTVIRVDLRAEEIDIVAGGLRNAYDLAFHPDGSLYVHDSDMEADIGTTWHRSTNLFAITEGGEYGWRSGWAAWPDYYLDRLPALVDTGRGSPTGATFYDHYQFPAAYHEHLFLADWTKGRILKVDVRPGKDGTLPAASEFVVGTPMNVTDIDVGPDGSLYFCTGGRGTGGGIYRVRYTGEPMLRPDQLGDGIASVIRQPQLTTAWGRQTVALKKSEIGEAWDELITGVAYSPDNPARYRMRALDLMQLVGPVPTVAMLLDLSRTPSEAVRAKVATQLGYQADDEAFARLTEMLSDVSPVVVTSAAEALVRSDRSVDVGPLAKLLTSDDRRQRFLARRLLLRCDSQDWTDELLTSEDVDVVLNAALAAMIADPTPRRGDAVLNRLHHLINQFLTDAQFVDLLRVYQVVLHLHEPADHQIEAISTMVSREFPAGEAIINRELIRLAAYVRCDAILPRVVKYLGDSKIPMPDRLHVAMYTCSFNHNWSSDEAVDLLKFFEEAAASEGGKSYELYIMQTSQKLGRLVTAEQAAAFLAEATKYPNATLTTISRLPATLDDQLYSSLVAADEAIDKQGFEADILKRLKTGFTATLARSGDDRSFAYLRRVWRRSPDRRATIALAMAGKPEGDNWDYIIRSLGLLDDYAVSDVLSALTSAGVATDDPLAVRQVIQHALAMNARKESPEAALKLLAYWHGDDLAAKESTPTEKIAAWQRWYKMSFPNQPDPALPSEEESRWTVEQLEEYFVSDGGDTGSVAAGKLVYEQAQCASCHRFDGTGTSVGPDLNSLASRFTRAEVLESLLHPSQVISDQYASKKVLTVDDRILTGMYTEIDANTVQIRSVDGHVEQLSVHEIEEQMPSKQSFMPSGLLDHFTQPQIRDLMAYLRMLPAADSPAVSTAANPGSPGLR